MVTPNDARARTLPLPDDEELVPSPGLRFDAFAITNASQSTTFFKTGCAVCPDASLSLHATPGRIRCTLPNGFWTSLDVTTILDFTSDVALSNLHLVQCMYLGDRVQVESLAFGPVQANVATSWTRKRMNPFYFATPSAMTSPARSDVFYFNEKNALVGHHRLLLGSVLTPDNHYKNQLVDHVVLRERASIRTTLHKVVIVPSLYKYNRDVLLDAIDDGADDIVRLLVDHGADIKGVCSNRLLARALDQSDVETAIYALKHGADVQSRIEGHSQLARMVLAGNDAMLEVLVNAGAYLGDPCDLHKYIRCGRRCPPTEASLVVAYMSNLPRMAQLLLDLHAPIDVVQKAAPRNCLLALCLPHLTDECARRWHILQLLERGAATMMHKPNQDGMTPYELATAMGATTIRKSFDLYTKSSAAKLADDGPVDDNCASPAGSSALSYTYDSDASDDVLDQ